MGHCCPSQPPEPSLPWAVPRECWGTSFSVAGSHKWDGRVLLLLPEFLGSGTALGMCSRSSCAESGSGGGGQCSENELSSYTPSKTAEWPKGHKSQRGLTSVPSSLTCAYSSLGLYFSPSTSHSLVGNNLSLLHVDGLSLSCSLEYGPEDCHVSLVSADLPTASCVWSALWAGSNQPSNLISSTVQWCTLRAQQS